MLIAIVLSGVACTEDGTVDARRSLADALDQIPDPPAFGFTYRAQGTTVLDCVLPNREFVVKVDRDRTAMAIESVEGRLLVRRDGQSVLLGGSMFSNAPTGVRLNVPLEEALSPAIRRVLGVDLAGYVLADGLPDPPAEIARAALKHATAVDSLPSADAPASATTGYRLAVQDTSGAFILDVWIAVDTSIARLAVSPTSALDGTRPGDQTAAGWVSDFFESSALGSPTADSGPVDITSLDPARLSPAAPDACAVAI